MFDTFTQKCTRDYTAAYTISRGSYYLLSCFCCCLRVVSLHSITSVSGSTIVPFPIEFYQYLAYGLLLKNEFKVIMHTSK